MARGNPGRVWTIKENGTLAISLNKEQTEETRAAGKVWVYATEVTQLSLFDELPAVKKNMRRLVALKDLELTGFYD